MTQAGNPAFWTEVIKFGMELGLISSKEAKKLGGESTVLEKEASEVCFLLPDFVLVTLTPTSAVYLVLTMDLHHLSVIIIYIEGHCFVIHVKAFTSTNPLVSY